MAIMASSFSFGFSGEDIEGGEDAARDDAAQDSATLIEDAPHVPARVLDLEQMVGTQTGK